MNKFLILLYAIAIVSCTAKTDTNEALRTIELKESKDFLPISSFISVLEYLELKANEASVEIGEIQAIKIYGDDLIVKHRKAGEISFVRFTQTGEYVNELLNNKNGKVAQPRDIIPYGKDYAVLGEKGIYVVSKQGEFKGAVLETEMNGSRFFKNKSNFSLISELAEGELLATYKKGQKSREVVPLNERFKKLLYTNVQEMGKNRYHLVSSFHDMVYAFENNQLREKYKLESSDCLTLSKVWQDVGDKDPKETMRYIYDTPHILVKNYLENDDMIFMTYWNGSNSTTVIVKKDTWETLYYARGVNDIDGGIWLKALYLNEENQLYVPLSAYRVGAHKISNKRHNDFEQLQAKIAASGNPVIMKCTLE